jgi:ankyrin repeat protein
MKKLINLIILSTFTLSLSAKDLSEDEKHLLMNSAMGNLEKVKQLVKQKKVNVNVKDPMTGDTALHFAQANRHHHIVDYLKEVGAKIQKNARGETPEALAIRIKKEMTESMGSDHGKSGGAAW